MCLLCSDEKVYAAYMQYLDAMERQGQDVDPDKAIEHVRPAPPASAELIDGLGPIYGDGNV